MRKILLASAFAAAFAGTAFADGFKNPFYVAIDRSTGRCVMMQFMGAGGPGAATRSWAPMARCGQPTKP